jgi:hypothetical protein
MKRKSPTTPYGKSFDPAALKAALARHQVATEKKWSALPRSPRLPPHLLAPHLAHERARWYLAAHEKGRARLTRAQVRWLEDIAVVEWSASAQAV